MATPREQRVLALARAVGATQEALRLGHALVGSEHVLMASFADPIVRRSLMRAGCDPGEVQTSVTVESTRRNGDEIDMSARRARDVRVDSDAEELLLRALADLPDLPPGRRLEPRQHSRALGQIMITVLHDHDDNAATRVLGGFDVGRYASDIVAAIREGGGPATLPREG